MYNVREQKTKKRSMELIFSSNFPMDYTVYLPQKHIHAKDANANTASWPKVIIALWSTCPWAADLLLLRLGAISTTKGRTEGKQVTCCYVAWGKNLLQSANVMLNMKSSMSVVIWKIWSAAKLFCMSRESQIQKKMATFLLRSCESTRDSPRMTQIAIECLPFTSFTCT